jgi:hypothetical protein
MPLHLLLQAKHERSDAFKALHDEVVAYLGEELAG